MATKTYNPRFYAGERATLTRYLPPILCGSTVAILEVRATGDGFRYQVQAEEYPGAPVWAYDEDLAPVEM